MSRYGELLRDPRWQKRRLKIMERDDWKCVLCERETNTLNVHHIIYKGSPWEVDDKYLVTLCENCHKNEEMYKAQNADLAKVSNKTGVLVTSLLDLSIAFASMSVLMPDEYKLMYNQMQDTLKNNTDEIIKILKDG